MGAVDDWWWRIDKDAAQQEWHKGLATVRPSSLGAT